MVKCSICNKEEGRGKNNICRKCWRKEHTKKNRNKLAVQGRQRYLKNRERRLKQSSDWQKKNKDRVNEKCKEYYYKNPKRKNVRGNTLRIYGHLIRNSVCQNCSSKDRLEFHHPEPYKVDDFVILCFNCHRVLHGQLFPQFAIPKNHASFEDRKVTNGN